MKSVQKLAALVETQNEYNSDPQNGTPDYLTVIKFMRVKMLPEVLHVLCTDVLYEMKSLTQLKLSGINLNHTRVVDQL